MPHKSAPSKAELRHFAILSALSPSARFGLAIELSQTLTALNRIKTDGTETIRKRPGSKTSSSRH